MNFDENWERDVKRAFEDMPPETRRSVYDAARAAGVPILDFLWMIFSRWTRSKEQTTRKLLAARKLLIDTLKKMAWEKAYAELKLYCETLAEAPGSAGYRYDARIARLLPANGWEVCDLEFKQYRQKFG